MLNALVDMLGVSNIEDSVVRENNVNLSNISEAADQFLTDLQNDFSDRKVGLHIGQATTGELEGHIGLLELSGGLEYTFGATYTPGNSIFFNRPQFNATATGSVLAGIGAGTPGAIPIANEKVTEVSMFFGEASDLSGVSVSLEFRITINGATAGFGATVPKQHLDTVVKNIEEKLLNEIFNSRADREYLLNVISEIFPDGSMLTLKGGNTLGVGTNGVKVGVEVNYTGIGSDGIDALNNLKESLGSSKECFLSSTPILLSDGTSKPISEIKADDLVLSYDAQGRLVPSRVTRTFRNEVIHVLDFWGTGVTPGHAYLCTDGKFEGRHVPLMDILRTDGAIMRDDGTLVRAATNCELGSEGDQMIHAIVGDKEPGGQITIRAHAQIRLGTRVILENGTDVSVQELIAASGSEVTDEGLIRTSNGQELPFHWSFSHDLPKPEDYILKRSDVSLDEIYQANEWEQIGTQLAAPEGASNGVANNGLMLQPSNPLPNVPPAFANHPDAPKGRLNRKQRRAMAKAIH